MDDYDDLAPRKLTRSFSVVNWKPSDTQGHSGSSWKFWRRLSIRSRGHANGRSKVVKHLSEPAGSTITKADIGEPSLDLGQGPQRLPDVVVEGAQRLPFFNANAIPPPKPPRLFLSKTPSRSSSRSSSAESISTSDNNHKQNNTTTTTTKDNNKDNNNDSSDQQQQEQQWHLLDSGDFTLETREALGRIADCLNSDDNKTATTHARRRTPAATNATESNKLSSPGAASPSSPTPPLIRVLEEQENEISYERERQEGGDERGNYKDNDNNRDTRCEQTLTNSGQGAIENNNISKLSSSTLTDRIRMGNSVVPLCLINDDTAPVVNENDDNYEDNEGDSKTRIDDNSTIINDQTGLTAPPSPPSSQPPPLSANKHSTTKSAGNNTSTISPSPPKSRYATGNSHKHNIYSQYHQNGYGTVPRKPKIVTPELSQKRFRRPRSRKLSSCDDQVSRQWRIMTSVLDLMCQRLDPYPLLDPLKRAGILTNIQLQSFLGHCDRRSICEGLVDIIGKGTTKCLSVFSAAIAACPGNCTEILEILQAMREIDRLVYDIPEHNHSQNGENTTSNTSGEPSSTPATSTTTASTDASSTTASTTTATSTSVLAEEKILNFDIGYLSTDYSLKPLVELERARSNSAGSGASGNSSIGGSGNSHAAIINGGRESGGYKTRSRNSSYSLFEGGLGSTTTLDKAGYGIDPMMFSGLVMMSVTINGHNLAGDRFHALVDVIRTHNCISELHLGKTHLSGQEVTSLTEALSGENSGSTTCHTLDLRLNTIGATGAEGLCQLLRQTRFLRVLNLSSTELNSLSFQDVVAAISGNKSLVEFDGSFLEISDECCVGLKDMLRSNNTNLQKLRLRGNNITPVGCQTLCKGLAKNISLSVLDLSRNPIGDVGVEALAFYLPDSHVTEVYIDGCGISPIGGTSLAEMVSGSRRLRHLDVSTNDLRDAGVKRLAAALERTLSLQTISLNMCSITNEGFSRMIDAMERNTSIHRLKLCYNKIGDGTIQNDSPATDVENLRCRLRIVLSSKPNVKIMLWGNAIEDSK